ncbi:MAG: hypothetical protein Q9217_002815 [Psora testacea]
MSSPQSVSNLHPDVSLSSRAFVPEFIHLTPPPDTSTTLDFDGRCTRTSPPQEPSPQRPHNAPASDIPALERSSKMKLVDAHAVRNLLTENVDENVAHYAVLTDHGTLLSHDHHIHKSELTKFAPFAGTVWRNHNASITSTGSTNLSVGGLPAMRTLKVDMKPDGTGLRSLVVELDGIVSVLRLIIPRLLVAAQLETAKFAGETDEVSIRIGNLKIDNGEDEDRESASSFEYHRGGEGEESESGGATQNGDDATTKDGSDAVKKPGKMRILELKAEGMAEYLADEYPAQLPHDFY